ncbi:fibroblast growth factor 10-like [Scleropages formosus]|uniref:Fibroblast growth factor 10-like n=1 Tax=Scleropages formosus TaxID=113540 RepID=A0A0P7XG56_SCLFO|nr:fibroblast growth factor 10-like [Scleropages formosus]
MWKWKVSKSAAVWSRLSCLSLLLALLLCSLPAACRDGLRPGRAPRGTNSSVVVGRHVRSYNHLQGDVRRRKLFSFQKFFLRIDKNGKVNGTKSKDDPFTALASTVCCGVLHSWLPLSCKRGLCHVETMWGLWMQAGALQGTDKFQLLVTAEGNRPFSLRPRPAVLLEEVPLHFQRGVAANVLFDNGEKEGWLYRSLALWFASKPLYNFSPVTAVGVFQLCTSPQAMERWACVETMPVSEPWCRQKRPQSFIWVPSLSFWSCSIARRLKPQIPLRLGSGEGLDR